MEQIGLEAVMRTDSFMDGLKHFLMGMEEARNANASTARSMNQMNPAAGAATVALGGMTMGSMALAVALGTALYAAVVKVTGALIDMAKNGLMSAARVQELDVVLQVLAQRAGLSKAAIDEQVASIVSYGIQTDVAMNLVSEMIRYQMDMTKATELARVAQDTAVITMTDSSEELSRLIHGIEVGSTEMLRYAGIQISAESAMKEYAATLHKTVPELTSAERAQATLNAVLADGAKNAGIYEAAMETPGKQLRSFTRDMYELTRVMGTPFLTAFGTIVNTMRDLAKTWRTAIDEGGRLHGIMVFLGAAASIIADAFTNLVKKASDGVLNFLSWLSDSFEGAATKALDWGANIITQLATGIIQAAMSALTWAMNYVASLLENWLKGSSPPKVAKDIIKWGANAIAQWVKGLTMVDFSALKELQSPIKAALDALVGQGKMKAEQVGKAYAGISKAIAEALKSGNVTAALDAIRKNTGAYGDELVALAKAEFELASAQKAAKKAQDDLNAAQKAAYMASVKVNDTVKEYNKMLRAGASKEALANKLKEVNVADQGRKTAEDEAKAAQEKYDASQANLALLKEQVDIQKEVVGQMLEIMNAQIASQKALEAAAKAAAAAAAAAKVPGGGGGVGKIDLATAMSKAIEEAKKKILTKLNELWTAIKQSVSDAIAPYLQPFKDAWDNLSKDIQPALDKLKKDFEPTWEDIKLGWDVVWTYIQLQALDFTTTFEQFWRDHGDSIIKIINPIWDEIKTHAGEQWQLMLAEAEAFLPLILLYATRKFEDMKMETKVGLDILGMILDLASGKMKINWQGLWDNLEYVLNNAWNDIKEALYQAWKDILEYFGGIVSKFMQAGIDIVKGLIDGINQQLGPLEALFKRIADSLPEWLKKLLGMTSPSKVFMKIGVGMMEGLAQGIKISTVLPEKAVKQAAVNVARPIYVRGSTVNNVNMNMGGFNVNNGMDVAMIKTIIRQTVAEAVGGSG